MVQMDPCPPLPRKSPLTPLGFISFCSVVSSVVRSGGPLGLEGRPVCQVLRGPLGLEGRPVCHGLRTQRMRKGDTQGSKVHQVCAGNAQGWLWVPKVHQVCTESAP